MRKGVKAIVEGDWGSVQKSYSGGFDIYRRTPGGLMRVHLPDDIPAEAYLAMGAELKPAPTPKKKKAPKKKAETTADGE